MAHKVIQTNLRVEVTPDLPAYIGVVGNFEKERRITEELLNQINRHCDDVLAAVVVWDTRYLCEFCGYDLTDEPHRADDAEAIECCQAEIDSWQARHPRPEIWPGIQSMLDDLTIRPEQTL